MQFGIDKISFATASYYLDLKTLAAHQQIPTSRFYDDLGQQKMSICAPDEDIVTMAATAASNIVTDVDLLLFATESSYDCSKAAGLYLHKLLNLSPHCRVIELKQACYGATAGLQLALAMLRQHPQYKILLVASDIAHYALNSSGESSQGAGAIAMLLTANPRILSIHPTSGIYTQDAMDFWRPNYLDYPLLDGKLSCNLYLTALEKTWQQYTLQTQKSFTEHAYFCYHTPVPKLVTKAHKLLCKINQQPITLPLEATLLYNRIVGNCYTASLYLSILSLLENLPQDASNQLIGLYSYGSGCTGEYFSGTVTPNYQTMLPYHQKLLAEREELSYDAYLKFYNFKLPHDNSSLRVPRYTKGNFRLAAYEQHQRIYE